jgi:hypothetical protein|tara:strand:+ start:663 stop:821 length:159 start_codon:yes stop_codon:yes gene_type:complete
MRIKEVDKNIDLFYNTINETDSGSIAAVVTPLFQEPIKRKASVKKKKKIKDA